MSSRVIVRDGRRVDVVRVVEPNGSSTTLPTGMRGLTLTQPWASLMGFGEKRIETRSWKTDWRGLVAIYAAKGLNGLASMGEVPRYRGPKEEDLWELCREEPFAGLLQRHVGMADGKSIGQWLPRGQVVAVGRLVACLETGGGPGSGTMDLSLVTSLSLRPIEEHLGDYGPHRYGWVFDMLVGLAPGITLPAPRYKRGLWEVWEGSGGAVLRDVWLNHARID